MRRWPFWACLAVMLAVYLSMRAVSEPAAVGLSVAGVLLLAVVARADGLGAVDLGLAGWDNTRRGLRWGLVCAALAATFYVVLLLTPARELLVDDRTAESFGPLVIQIIVVIPLQTVLWEEFAFRGVLWAIVRRDHGWRVATAVSSSLFGLWHVLPAISFSSSSGAVDGTVGTGDAATGLTVLATVLFTGLAGVLLCELRRRSGSLLAPVAAHWSTNGLGALASWLA
jgi:membrane protease YdiL (CAAX protease family)